MIKLKGIHKQFGNDQVLEEVNLTIEETGIYIIKGKSGCGKTTLLNIIGLIDEDYVGEYYLNGQKINLEKDKSIYRRNYFTYLHQFPYFIENETVENNLLLISKNLSSLQIHNALKKMHLEGYQKRIVSSLSGGEKRRLSFCSVLLKDTPIILCDEVTSALDYENKVIVMESLKKLSQNHIIIFVTHEEELVQEYAREILYIKDKKLIYNQEEKKRNISLSKKGSYLSFKYIISHILRIYKTKRIRMMMSIFTIVVSLIALGLSIEIKNIVDSSVKNTLKDNYKENQIIASLKKDSYYVDELLFPNYEETYSIKSKFFEVEKIVPFYSYNFEENFSTSNRMIFQNGREIVDFEKIGVRSVSEYLLMDEVDLPFEKMNLNEEQIVLALPLYKIYELCKVLRLNEDVEILHKRIRNNPLKVSLIVANSSWDYEITIDFMLVDFVVSSSYHIIHSSSLWSERILEGRMRLVTTSDFYKDEFIPWELKKGYALKVKKENSDDFISSFLQREEMNLYNLHLLKEDILLSLEQTISNYDNFCVSINNEDRIFYSDLIKIEEDNSINSFIPCSSSSYMVYDEALLQGFNYTFALSNNMDEIVEFSDENEYSSSSLGPFQSNIMYCSNKILLGDAISSSKKNSFKTKAISSSSYLLEGEYPSSYNEIVVSTGLIDYFDITYQEGMKLPIAVLKKIERKGEEIYKNSFYNGELVVRGLIRDEEKCIYVTSSFSVGFYIKNILDSVEKMKVEKVIINVNEEVDVEKTLSYLNDKYNNFSFS
ncbi:MAG: ATP-binding cassette domain-containing protein, partial [Bacilli bacterium]